MRKFLTVLLAGVSALAIAQKKTDHNRSIDHDGKAQTPIAYSINEISPHIMSARSYEIPAVESGDPYTKQVRYNTKSGELFLKYTFSKENEEYIYEKTVNAFGKSDEERQTIVTDFEIEIALPGGGI